MKAEQVPAVLFVKDKKVPVNQEPEHIIKVVLPIMKAELEQVERAVVHTTKAEQVPAVQEHQDQAAMEPAERELVAAVHTTKAEQEPVVAELELAEREPAVHTTKVEPEPVAAEPEVIQAPADPEQELITKVVLPTMKVEAEAAPEQQDQAPADQVHTTRVEPAPVEVALTIRVALAPAVAGPEAIPAPADPEQEPVAAVRIIKVAPAVVLIQAAAQDLRAAALPWE